LVKVSIPREALEQIMEEYQVDESAATRVYLDAQDRAQEAYKRHLANVFGRPPGEQGDHRSFEVPVHTPKEIKAHLDKFVIGQEEYKKRIAIAAAYHFAMLKFLYEHPDQTKVRRFRKKNTITAGPSGSGKTYCVEVLGDLLEVPTLIVDATDYTEAGYVGKSADDMIRELIDLAPGSSRHQQANFVSRHGGIIFIDEIDKKAKDGRLIGHDISREGFQRAVLKLVERKLVSIDNPMSPASQIQEALDRQRGLEPDPAENMISTEKILFILGGSFERPQENLESIVKRRLARRGGRDPEEDGFVIQGFSPPEEDGRGPEHYRNYFADATADDYIRFGLIPELVGRSPIRTFVNLLSKNDLVRIMTDTEDSIVEQYRTEFDLFGIDLNLADDAVDYVAEVAENKRTGARALVSVWENILTDFQYELPGSNFSHLKVDRALCERPKDALLTMVEKSPIVDFLEGFRRQYGVELVLDEQAEQYIEQYAREKDMQISDAIQRLLAGAGALNYMDIKGPYQVTREMLEDQKYFERLFTQWHQERKSKGDSS
jgi:ATP-dependent Clp protease ATP-binding subunit ClpX